MHMRLLLSSAGLRSEIVPAFRELLNRDPHGLHAAFIPTAGDHESHTAYLEVSRQQLINLGFKVTNFDLKSDKIEAIEGQDIVFVAGGNTYYLLYWMRKSGFADSIAHWLKNGLIYVGESAGSIVAGPDIGLAGWKPFADVNNIKLTDLTGIDIVDFTVSPHYRPDNEEHVKLICRQKEGFQHKVYCLTDEQAIIVQGSEVRTAGVGEVATLI